jgi:YfiH family protein
MDLEFHRPKTPLGDRIHCLTLTRNFFDKHQINADKDNLINNFLSYKDIPIQYMDQIHGKNLGFISSHSSKPIANTDALFSSSTNLALAVFSADCLPIALCKTDGSQFAIIHAGWKGLVSGVVETSISSFTNSSNLCAWIGPSISKQNYEVGKDLYDAFMAKDKNSILNFSKRDSYKFLFNLQGEAERILKKYKINVQTSDICTYNSSSLYSYRKEETENRIVTIIWREA